MRDTELLQTLLASETETDVIKALEARGLLEDKSRWRYLGNMPNNQSAQTARVDQIFWPLIT